MFGVEGLRAGYTAGSTVVRDLALEVGRGEVLCLMGRNGAGKSTTLRAVMGLVPERSGRLVLGGRDISALPPFRIPSAGIGYVPQGRRLFSELTVRENLEVGAWSRGPGGADFARVFDLFPVLEHRQSQVSGTLSGGEQQMLAMARALCLEPRLLLLDEPTEGLMPSMISAIRDVVRRLSEQGVAVLMVEQRIDAVLSVADRVAFMENGELKEVLAARDVAHGHDLVRRYVGVG